RRPAARRFSHIGRSQQNGAAVSAGGLATWFGAPGKRRRRTAGRPRLTKGNRAGRIHPLLRRNGAPVGRFASCPLVRSRRRPPSGDTPVQCALPPVIRRCEGRSVGRPTFTGSSALGLRALLGSRARFQ